MAIGPDIEITRLTAVLRGLDWQVVSTNVDAAGITVTVRKPFQATGATPAPAPR